MALTPDPDRPHDPSPAAGQEPRPGLREQLTRTIAAGRRLADAHLELLKAEVGAIVADLKAIAALAGLIAAVALYAGLLLVIGGTLFLGEWLFGSIGWGLVHGLVLSVGLIVALAMVLLGAPARIPLRAFAVAVLVGVLFAVVAGAELPHRAAVAAGDALRQGGLALDPTWQAAVVGLVAGAIVLGLVALLLGARAGGARSALGSAILGVVLGIFLGALVGGLTWSWHGAVATGILVGGLVWPALTAAWALGAGLDPAARFARLAPRASLEAAEETRTWLEQAWTKRRERIGRR
jgi:hypothetical protein